MSNGYVVILMVLFIVCMLMLPFENIDNQGKCKCEHVEVTK
jgi:hypothetical protein